jgi:hypothetical protein
MIYNYFFSEFIILQIKETVFYFMNSVNSFQNNIAFLKIGM